MSKGNIIPYADSSISTSNTLLIGDAHGKINEYWKILQKHKNGNSRQLGDFGFKKQHEWHLKNIDNTRHKIVFGNHDDIAYLYSPHSCGDFSISLSGAIMTVRGAKSIDRWDRTENVDWWSNEELSYHVMQQAIDCFTAHRPKIMLSHDCPYEIRKSFFNIDEKSITSNGFQAMFEAHQPDLWIFGHWHRSFNEVANGTRFICLNELETILI